jgi:hypothetical protein
MKGAAAETHDADPPRPPITTNDSRLSARVFKVSAVRISDARRHEKSPEGW